MWVLLSTMAGAATWVVPVDFPTITDAVAGSASGDIIEIDPGTYTEHVTVVGLELTFQGRDGVQWQGLNGQDPLECTTSASCTVRNVGFDGTGTTRSIRTINADLVVSDCSFEGGSVVSSGGAIYATEGGEVVIADSTFDGNHTTESGGHVRAIDAPLVDIRRSTFVGGSADIDAGAIRVGGITIVVLEDLWLEGNTAGDDGGAIDVSSATTFDMRCSFLCGNSAVDDGGAAVVRNTTTTLVGNVFLSNETDGTGGGFDSDLGSFVSQNNTYADNRAVVDGAAVNANNGHSSTNDLFAWNEASQAVADPAGAVDYGLFWSNPSGDTNATTTNTLFADPLLAASPPTVCDPLLLVPTILSPVIDAGSPALSDVDGGDSDIGAFGGPDPYADVEPVDVDNDGDGVSVGDGDCDDNNAAVFPGANEACDGLDTDCDGAIPLDEIDNDGDGVFVCEGDCDDADAGAFPGATEEIADGVDQDCDGGDDCYEDTDLDGYGEVGIIGSADLDCTDAGEAPRLEDICVGSNDNIDTDGDQIPDGCDLCPLDNPDDSDLDGVCTSDDLCEGWNDLEDTDGDGVPNGCDTCDSPYDSDKDGTPDDCDLCPGYPDSNDVDGDAVPDDCDPCPLDNPDDSDSDGVCDADDLCPGYDDRIDANNDGIPDDCEGAGPTGDTGTPPGTTPTDPDSDGDGIPDSIDPNPNDAGGDGQSAAPEPPSSCGCAATPVPPPLPILLLALVLLRRRTRI